VSEIGEARPELNRRLRHDSRNLHLAGDVRPGIGNWHDYSEELVDFVQNALRRDEPVITGSVLRHNGEKQEHGKERQMYGPLQNCRPATAQRQGGYDRG
jgi:hypothetical protein